MAEGQKSVDELLDQLLEGRKPGEILGREGLLEDLTKRLVERALEGEMTAHLGYERHAAEGRNRSNSPVQDWPAALYHLSLVFPGRVAL